MGAIQTIRIDSVLGGISPMNYFSKRDQFKFCLGIDPSLAVNDSTAVGASGLLRPSTFKTITSATSSTFSSTPLWMLSNPKDSNIYIYDQQGSVYSQNIASGGVPH